MTQGISEAAATSSPVRGQRIGRLAWRLAIMAVAVAFIGLCLARYDLIPKMTGFMAFLGGGAVSLLALLLGLGALIAGRKGAFPGRGRVLVAVVVSLFYVGFLASRPLMADDGPALHDITTDLANPPQFLALPLRADNLVGVGTLENWRTLHAAAYGDLGPVTIAKPVAVVTADAVRLAEDAGWEIAAHDAARGHLEATASVSFIRFRDDVVIRIVPVGDGHHSRVDMRSVSRVGVDDLGVNARRIRSFLASLTSA